MRDQDVLGRLDRNRCLWLPTNTGISENSTFQESYIKRETGGSGACSYNLCSHTQNAWESSPGSDMCDQHGRVPRLYQQSPGFYTPHLTLPGTEGHWSFHSPLDPHISHLPVLKPEPAQSRGRAGVKSVPGGRVMPDYKCSCLKQQQLIFHNSGGPKFKVPKQAGSFWRLRGESAPGFLPGSW